MNEQIIAWLLSAVLAWAPQMAKNDSVERRAEIVRDAAAVADDPAEPPVYQGENARARTALLLLSVASFESGGFDPKVESGDRRGDSGASWCLTQIRIGDREFVFLEPGGAEWANGASGSGGMTGPALAADRRSCFRAALHMIRDSMRMCGFLPEEHRLAGYTVGRCVRSAASSLRWGRAAAWASKHEAPR
jgi:hypothetical protein